jgi:hypothetical protein
VGVNLLRNTARHGRYGTRVLHTAIRRIQLRRGRDEVRVVVDCVMTVQVVAQIVMERSEETGLNQRTGRGINPSLALTATIPRSWGCERNLEGVIEVLRGVLESTV